MPKKLSYEYVKSSFESSGHKLVTTFYKNCTQELECICSNGHKYTIKWDYWKAGFGCVYCSGHRHDPLEIKKLFESEGYRLITTYINARQRLYYVCPNGHNGYTTFANWSLGHRCRKCSIDNSRGSNSSAWKGGLTPIYKAIRNYSKSHKWADNIFARDDYTCKKCSVRGCVLNAHHIISINNILGVYNIKDMNDVVNCSMVLDIDNGVTLCETCHVWVHSHENIDKMFIKELI